MFTNKRKLAILVPGVDHRAFFKHEPARAVWADDFVGCAHLQVDLRMSQGAATAITGNALLLNFDDFGGGHVWASFVGGR